jgi:hypothetical protein
MTEKKWLKCKDSLFMLEFLHDSASARKLRLFAGACFRRIGDLLVDDRSRQAVEVAERVAEGLINEEALEEAVTIAEPARQEAWDIYERISSQSCSTQVGRTPGSEHDVTTVFSRAPQVAKSGEDLGHERSYVGDVLARALYEAAYAVTWISNPCDSDFWHCPDGAAQAAGTAALLKPIRELPFIEGCTDTEEYAWLVERWEQSLLLRDIVGNPFRPVTIGRSWQTPTVLSLAQTAYDNRDMPSGTLQPEHLAVLADALEKAGAGSTIVGHLRNSGSHVRGCFVVDLLLGKE